MTKCRFSPIINVSHFILSLFYLSHSYPFHEIWSSILFADEPEIMWSFSSSSVLVLSRCYCLELKNLTRNVKEKCAFKINIHPVLLEGRYLLKSNGSIQYLKEMVYLVYVSLVLLFWNDSTVVSGQRLYKIVLWKVDHKTRNMKFQHLASRKLVLVSCLH